MAFTPPNITDVDVDSPVDTILFTKYLDSIKEIQQRTPSHFIGSYYKTGFAPPPQIYFLDAAVQTGGINQPMFINTLIYIPEGINSLSVNIRAQASVTNPNATIDIFLAGIAGSVSYGNIPGAWAWLGWQMLTPAPGNSGWQLLRVECSSTVGAVLFELRGLMIVPDPFMSGAIPDVYISSDEIKNDSPSNTDLYTKLRDQCNLMLEGIPLVHLGGEFFNLGTWTYLVDAAAFVVAGTSVDMIKDIQLYVPEGIDSVDVCIYGASGIVGSVNHFIDVTIGTQTVSVDTTGWAGVYPNYYKSPMGNLSGLSSGWNSLTVSGRVSGGGANTTLYCRGIGVVPSTI